MRIFDHPNMNGFQCPVCKMNTDLPVVLIGIEGTENGGNIEARQYHVECLDLIEKERTGVRYLIQAVPR